MDHANGHPESATSHHALKSLGTGPATVSSLLEELGKARLAGVERYEVELLGGDFGEGVQLADRDKVERVIDDYCSPAKIEWDGWRKLVVTFGLSDLHEAVAGPLSCAIDLALAQEGLGKQVVFKGSAGCKSAATGHALQPDGSWRPHPRLSQDANPKSATVILEVAFSQTLQAVKAKVESFLKDPTLNIKLGIIVHLVTSESSDFSLSIRSYFIDSGGQLLHLKYPLYTVEYTSTSNADIEDLHIPLLPFTQLSRDAAAILKAYEDPQAPHLVVPKASLETLLDVLRWELTAEYTARVKEVEEDARREDDRRQAEVKGVEEADEAPSEHAKQVELDDRDFTSPKQSGSGDSGSELSGPKEGGIEGSR